MSAIITRHPDAATLMSFAGGSLPEPLAATLAGHVAMCRHCQGELRDMELIGAVLLQSAPPAVAARRFERGRPPLPSDADSHGARGAGRKPSRDRLPGPIAEHYGLSFESIPWTWLAPGVWHHRLALSAGIAGDLRLLRIAAGVAMPEHGHGGTELTLVLDGAYGDETGSYRRGDMQEVDGEVEHRPVADREVGCVCLIASERPARFKGLVGRLLQSWTGL